MSRNYDNWERLVAAVEKREQIWQLCHQDSVSTIYSDYSSSRLDFSLPISLGSSGITNTFNLIRPLKKGKAGSSSTDLVELVQDVAVWDQIYVGKGTQAVVKSLTGSKITEDEFEQYMAVIGSCKHENVGTPWAYCFSQGTKLIMYDYYSQGSVSDMLRGSLRNMHIRPNWKSHLRIAIGAARGVAYIHKQWGGEMAHGNIKSSNVFLKEEGYGCVSDFGLVGILEKGKAGALASQKSDVYSFGVVLFEMFTRTMPMQEMDIDDHNSCFGPWWVLGSPRMLLVDELDMLLERTSLFIDKELLLSVEKEEFRRMMDVANRCMALLPGDRPTMAQVVSELEEMEAMTPPPPPQLSNQDSDKSGEKKRAWNRFLRFGA